MEISIVIPVFNVEKYIAKCLDSLLGQTEKNFEILIIDDGSEDQSIDICKKYISKFEEMKIFHQENKGTGEARNKGLKMAKGKYIYFCDPDDFLEPNLIEENYKLINRYKANMIIFGYRDIFISKKEKSYITDKKFSSVEFLRKSDFEKMFCELYDSNMLYTVWNKIYEKDFLSRNKLFFTQINLGQDTIFNLECYKYVDSLVLNTGVYYNYIISNPKSATNKYSSTRIDKKIAEVEYLKKTMNYLNIENQRFYIKRLWNALMGEISNVLRSQTLTNEEKALIYSDIKKHSINKFLYKNRKYLSLKDRINLQVYLNANFFLLSFIKKY